MRLNRLSLVLLGATAFTGPALAQQLPTGADVVFGANLPTVNGSTMTINQTAPGAAIINWDTFSIGAGGVVNVVQPSAAAALLNRVTSNTPSTIAGQLTSNGQVFLVNPNGIAITPTGVVNTGAFAASTLGISDQNFLAKNYTFEGDGSSETVSNAGQINIVPGGYAALIGGRVDNSGSIIAPFGRIGLGAAEMVTMDIGGDSFLSVAIPSNLSGDDPLISNSGLISADGGYIQMTVAAAKDLTRNVINLTGTTEARSVSGVNGAIVLSGDGGAVTIDGGTVNTSTRPGVQPPKPQVMIVPVPAPRPSYRGGDITITGGAIKLADATIDASGDEGGGNIKIGGDWHGNGLIPTSTNLDVDFLTSIVADALIDGDGGEIVLWSDGHTDFDGSISAEGRGDGIGGDVEVSGKRTLAFTGEVSTRAESGVFGTLLLDPYNIIINSAGPTTPGTGPAPTFTPGANDSVIDADDIETALLGSNVTISTGGVGSPGTQDGDITLGANIVWTTPTQLTLVANNSITSPIGAFTLNGVNGSIVLNARNEVFAGMNLNASSLTVVGGNVELGVVNVSGAVNITAQVPTGPGILTDRTGYVDFNSNINVGSLIVNAVGNITTIYDQATLNATGNVSMTTGADLFLGQLGATTVGGNMTLSAAQDAHISGTATVLGRLSVTAGRDILLESPTPAFPLPPATFRPANLSAPSVYLQSGGTLVIRAGSQVRSTAGSLIINTAIFQNNAGANAINSDGGRYLVYSNNWANDTRGGITGASVYGRPYASNPPSSIPGGVVFVYRDRPTLTVTVGDLMRMYFERNPNQPTINIAGLVNGDTFDYATNGTTFATDTTPITANIGTYAGALQLFDLMASDVGYNLLVDAGDIIVTPSPTTAPPAPFVFNNNGATGPTPGNPNVMPTTADIVTALVTEPDDLVAAVGIEVTPGAAEISLQAVERVSQQFTAQIAECERQLEVNGDEGAYLSCTGDALEAYADALENPLIKLPPELKATITVIRQTAQRVRTAAASPNKQAAVREARAAVGELVDFVKQQTALVRAVDPETQALLQQQGQVMTQALQELDLQLVGAVEI